LTVRVGEIRYPVMKNIVIGRDSTRILLWAISCVSFAFTACKEKSGVTPDFQLSEEEIGIANERDQVDLTLLQQAVTESLPEGWKLDDEFQLHSSSYRRLTTSPEVTEYAVTYLANPTTLMVSEGASETRFAVTSFAGSVLFTITHHPNPPEHLRYRGKIPPPSVEELMEGRTFVKVRQGSVFFRMKAEIRRSGGASECVVTLPPEPTTGSPRDKQKIYPYYKAKPETYVLGRIDDSMGIEPTRLLDHLVRDTIEKREAELKADGVDVNVERERIAAIQNLIAYSMKR
jgi:hypothetical protein